MADEICSICGKIIKKNILREKDQHGIHPKCHQKELLKIKCDTLWELIVTKFIIKYFVKPIFFRRGKKQAEQMCKDKAEGVFGGILSL